MYLAFKYIDVFSAYHCHYVDSRENSFHQLAHRVHRGKKRRQVDIPCSPTTKTAKTACYKLSIYMKNRYNITSNLSLYL